MTQPYIRIGDRMVGGSAPAFLIAEVAQAHDGSLGFAHAFVDLAREVGADAIKFQTHIAAAETTPLETFRVDSPMRTLRVTTIGSVWSSRQSSGRAWQSTRETLG